MISNQDGQTVDMLLSLTFGQDLREEFLGKLAKLQNIINKNNDSLTNKSIIIEKKYLKSIILEKEYFVSTNASYIDYKPYVAAYECTFKESYINLPNGANPKIQKISEKEEIQNNQKALFEITFDNSSFQPIKFEVTYLGSICDPDQI